MAGDCLEVFTLLLLALGLATDAFAVSICNGIAYRIPLLKNALTSATAFGLAQGVMPVLGYFLGSALSAQLEAVDHWIAFAVLSFIGVKMVLEAAERMKKPEYLPIRIFKPGVIFTQAIATSIDALVVGVTLGIQHTGIFVSAGAIGAVTFVCSFTGVVLGRKFGRLLGDKAEILGGIALIAIGIHNLFT